MTTQTDEPSGGPLRQLDSALTRRGFTTRRLRLRAAAVIVAITAGVSGVLLYNLTNVLGPDTVCGGAATADDLHAALGPGRISEEKSSGYSPTAYDRTNSCVATVSSGLFGKSERSASFSIGFNQNSVAYRPDPDTRLFSGASAGGVTPDRAWALLPEGCTKGLFTDINVGKGSLDGDRAEGAARMAVAYANLVAKDKNCGDGKMPAPENLSATGSPQPVDPGGICGLPGMAPAMNPGIKDRYRQQATTAFGPVWSCSISDPSDQNTLASFTITTDARVTGLDPEEARSEAYGRSRFITAPGENVVATCQGEATYFHLERSYDPSVSGSGLFADGKDLWKQFLTAGGKAIGCEPIIP
ncbi:hypothetical protein [Kitasatospora sp. NPDC088351]|uniref:hypothetical protein n=1 Tax=Kitasatospora sp. NPDC088351 TaxID=3155180 RepID=UPI00343BB558